MNTAWKLLLLEPCDS